MEKFIEKLVEEKKKLFAGHSREMISAYDRELKTISGYNGRQLLELVQNCDDEGSDEVYIRLDKEKKTVSISNNGSPFSEQGYESLFTSDYSSKVSRNYIGNKGLGFRSIINWSDAIEIHSNGLALTYTEENRRTIYNTLFSDDLHHEFLRIRNYQKHIIPMPFLSIPIVTTSSERDYVTTIKIFYKDEFLKSIVQQAAELTCHTLLFLKNLKKIRFEGFDGLSDIEATRAIPVFSGQFGPSESITFGNFEYDIFSTEDELPAAYADTERNGQELYQIKIALERSMNDSSPFLYSFFPTAIRLDQPYILHATFDLDVNRNQINKTGKNIYILERIAEFIIKVANYFSQQEVSYKPLRLAYHHHKADTLNNLGYYELIDTLILNEDLFPCVDSQYRKISDTLFVSNEFSEILLETKGTNVIGQHLLSMDSNLYTSRFFSKIPKDLSKVPHVISLLNDIAKKELTIPQRARYISLIVNEGSFIKSMGENQMNFLCDNTGNLLRGDDYIFTPPTNNLQLQVPKSANIQFISDALFEKLASRFEGQTIDEKRGKSRVVYDQLRGFCNIHSYEPAALAEKIIRHTNALVRSQPGTAILSVKKMHGCLYHNFKLMSEDTKLTDSVTNIPAIAKNGALTQTFKLMLCAPYPQGKLNEKLFAGIYTDANYIAPAEMLGLDPDEDITRLEEYLVWARVNRFAAYSWENGTTGMDNYVNYVQNQTGSYTQRSGYRVKVRTIEGFPRMLSLLSLEKLLIWIYYDPDLKNQLYNHCNEDVHEYYYYRYTTVSNAPSYLKYLILTQFKVKFDTMLLDDQYSWVNDFQLDYSNLYSWDTAINKTSINEILISLGATDDFVNLSIEKVASIINMLPEKYPTGNKSQTFYKKALKHFEKNQVPISSDLTLFANDGDEKVCVYKREDVYFSDKIKLPKRLRKDFPVFYFPSRGGGADAIKFFGINDLKDLTITLDSYTSMETLTLEFNTYLTSIKPYLLSNRINSSDDPAFRKNQASLCNKVKIMFCSDISYSVRDKKYEVLEYEFIHYEEQTYYMKIDTGDTLAYLRKNSTFTSSFAEIISLVFDVTADINDYKYIIRSDFEDVRLTIANDYGSDIINDAIELLGMANHKNAFWGAVLEAKGIAFPEQTDDQSFEEYLAEKLGAQITLSAIDYENLTGDSELLKLTALFKEIVLTTENFAKYYSFKFSLADKHYTTLSAAIMIRKRIVKSSVWESLKDKSVGLQANFLREIDKLESFDTYCRGIAEQFKTSLDISGEKHAENFIKQMYGDLKLIEALDLRAIGTKNLNTFGPDEQHIIKQSERLFSLSYFESALATIRAELLILQTMVKDNSDPDLVTKAFDSKSIAVQLLNGDNLNPRKPRAGGLHSGLFIPKEKSERKLKEIGNSAEDFVYEYMINNEYQDAEHVSKDNEGLHYDIRYTVNDKDVKFVEVKSFDSGNFYLSREEYNFGATNQENYEIWLVRNKCEIYVIRDFFTNSKYIKTVNEYIIYLEIEV